MRIGSFMIYTETPTITPGQEYHQSTFSANRKPGGFLLGSGMPSDDINMYVNGAYESGTNLIVIEEFSAPQVTSATADIVVILETND